jgi:hypothetical protein
LQEIFLSISGIHLPFPQCSLYSQGSFLHSTPLPFPKVDPVSSRITILVEYSFPFPNLQTKAMHLIIIVDIKGSFLQQLFIVPCTLHSHWNELNYKIPQKPGMGQSKSMN